MKKLISLIIVLIMVLSSVPLLVYADDFEYTSIASDKEWEILTEINNYRIQKGKNPVTMLISLQDACGVRSKELLSSLSHYRPDATPWYTVLESHNIPYNTESFEIIAANFTDTKSLINSISNQSISNEKLLSDYTHIGIGYSTSDTAANLSSFSLIGIKCNDSPAYSLCSTENIHISYNDPADNINVVLKRSCSHGNGFMRVPSSMIEGYSSTSVGTNILYVKTEKDMLPFTVIVDYTDIKRDAWYYDSVLLCTDKGYFSGTGKGEFNITGQMTREMFVTVLGRFNGIDPNEYKGSSFTDVKEDQWYSPYIEWAAKSSVVNGDGKGRFNGSSPITRQEICVILYNYINKYGIELEQTNAAKDFTDSQAIANWALEAVNYAQTHGIVSGNNKFQFMPVNKATRAEVAVIFANFHTALVSEDL